MSFPLLCPHCRGPLAPHGTGLACPAGHTFDRAREGYWNLLPAHWKASREPGDNPAMVAARRAFLSAGHYAPLRDALAEAVARLRPERLLDAGCGEGHYTAAAASAAGQVAGLDLSKPAIRLAARAHPGITWVVGNAGRLPVADGALDALLCVFSRAFPAEFLRALRPGGGLLLAGPGADHLAELRAALFDTVIPHEPDALIAPLAGAFPEARRMDLSFPLRLSAPDLRHLLAMTPYAWRARPERRQALEARTEGLATRASFVVWTLAARRS
jgi:23S rRNA (guanine745-N1)-methyltransferase